MRRMRNRVFVQHMIVPVLRARCAWARQKGRRKQYLVLGTK